jgi:hypothetical protein
VRRSIPTPFGSAIRGRSPAARMAIGAGTKKAPAVEPRLRPAAPRSALVVRDGAISRDRWNIVPPCLGASRLTTEGCGTNQRTAHWFHQERIRSQGSMSPARPRSAVSARKKSPGQWCQPTGADAQCVGGGTRPLCEGGERVGLLLKSWSRRMVPGKKPRPRGRGLEMRNRCGFVIRPALASQARQARRARCE